MLKKKKNVIRGSCLSIKKEEEEEEREEKVERRELDVQRMRN